MGRITKQIINDHFKQLCKLAGRRVATSYNDVGGCGLDYGYGGYKIEQILSATGATKNVITERRMKPRAFCLAMAYAIQFELARQDTTIENARNAAHSLALGGA